MQPGDGGRVWSAPWWGVFAARGASARLGRALWLLLSLVGCGPEGGDTSMLITIDSELQVPGEIDRVSIDTTGTLSDALQEPSLDLREKTLPRSLLLTYAGGLYGPFEIAVSAYHEDTLVTQKIVRTSFLPNIHSRLMIRLTRGCSDVFCEEGLTCNAGACTPVSETLPSALASDGGVTDAGAAPGFGEVALAAADAAIDTGAGIDAAMQPDAGSGRDASVLVDAGRAQDASGARDAQADPLPDSASSADTGSAPAPGAAPVCMISKPIAGATLLSNVTFALHGSCTDPETGSIASVLWLSSVDGPLATGGSTSAVLRTAGAHDLMLCAADPRDAGVIACSSVHVNATVQPTARILSLRQGTDARDPFVAGMALTIQGTATGTGATMSWRDSLQGALGSGSTVVLASPNAGRHVITLDVTDQYGITATATRTFNVLPGR